ncbi:MAG: hypothetical protein BGO31_04420 [Bacteroidetes bacterium 43-16]|nr:MAG: hypothetical protein BGO31_04420 [Bacteroidetes bacterium 43-16]
MKLSELKALLPGLDNVAFQLPDGAWVPEHFHVTEVGLVSRHFIDCGGTVRKEQVVNFQLWNADDYEHRLKPEKLLHIIRLSEEQLGITDLEIEVEYQSGTIGKYGLAFNNRHFILENKTTACLAQDACGIPQQKKPLQLAELKKSSCCGEGQC